MELFWEFGCGDERKDSMLLPWIVFKKTSVWTQLKNDITTYNFMFKQIEIEEKSNNNINKLDSFDVHVIRL